MYLMLTSSPVIGEIAQKRICATGTYLDRADRVKIDGLVIAFLCATAWIA
jgi:hypothetical protein